MPTKFVCICDPHISERRPQSRTDPNWQETLRGKLQRVGRLIDGQKVDAVVIAGDVFHQPKGPSIPRRVDAWFAREVVSWGVPVYTIPGNHDIEKENLKLLENHPYNVLCASGVLTDVRWPYYVVVGDDPPVIVTGREYTSEGPADWLSRMSAGLRIQQVREKVARDRGDISQPMVLAMTHCHWKMGLDDVAFDGVPLVGSNRLIGTGIDVMLYGDPHVYEGVRAVVDPQGGPPCYLVGPGALTRGALRESDINRKPTVALATFTPGDVKIVMVPIPHRPAAEVFDLDKHVRQKDTVKRDAKFMVALRDVESRRSDPREMLAAMCASGRISQKASHLAAQYLDQAREQREATVKEISD